MMNKWIIVLMLGVGSVGAKAQNVGVSFSFFFPEGGEFSMPVSPFSYRGVALPFSDYLGIQTGISLYRMGGLNVKGVPFESRKPFLGPNLTVYVPLELYFSLGNSKATFTLKAGGFGYYGFFNTLNEGNIDRAIKNMEGWTVANSNLTFKNLPGYGYQGGIEMLFSVTRTVAVTFEANYLMGKSKLELTGEYTGGNSGSLETKPVNITDSYINMRGPEVSFGLVFGSGR